MKTGCRLNSLRSSAGTDRHLTGSSVHVFQTNKSHKKITSITRYFKFVTVHGFSLFGYHYQVRHIKTQQRSRHVQQEMTRFRLSEPTKTFQVQLLTIQTLKILFPHSVYYIFLKGLLLLNVASEVDDC